MGTSQSNPVRERHWVCAQRLRERRLMLGLTQCEVVERLHRRGNRATNRMLSAVENGHGLDLGLLPELAEALGCTVTYLLGLTANPAAWKPAASAVAEPSAPSAETLPALRANRTGVLGDDCPPTWPRMTGPPTHHRSV